MALRPSTPEELGALEWKHKSQLVSMHEAPSNSHLHNWAFPRQASIILYTAELQVTCKTHLCTRQSMSKIVLPEPGHVFPMSGPWLYWWKKMCCFQIGWMVSDEHFYCLPGFHGTHSKIQCGHPCLFRPWLTPPCLLSPSLWKSNTVNLKFPVTLKTSWSQLGGGSAYL